MATETIRLKNNQNIRQKLAESSIKKEDHAEINDLIADEIDNAVSLVTSGVKDIYTADTAVYPTANGLAASVSNPAMSVTRIAKAAVGQTGDLVFNNLKKADGTAHANITVLATEAATDSIYYPIELRYNAATDTWAKLLVEKRIGLKGENSYRFPVSTNLPTANDGKIGDVWLYQETIDDVVYNYEITKLEAGWDLAGKIKVTGPQGRTPTTHYTATEPANALGVDGDIAKWTDVNGNRWETVKIAGVWDLANKYLSGTGENSVDYINLVWATNITIDTSLGNKYKLALEGDTSITLNNGVSGRIGTLVLSNLGNYQVTVTGQFAGDNAQTTKDVLVWQVYNSEVLWSRDPFGDYLGKKYISTAASIKFSEQLLAGGKQIDISNLEFEFGNRNNDGTDALMGDSRLVRSKTTTPIKICGLNKIVIALPAKNLTLWGYVVYFRDSANAVISTASSYQYYNCLTLPAGTATIDIVASTFFGPAQNFTSLPLSVFTDAQFKVYNLYFPFVEITTGGQTLAAGASVTIPSQKLWGLTAEMAMLVEQSLTGFFINTVYTAADTFDLVITNITSAAKTIPSNTSITVLQRTKEI